MLGQDRYHVDRNGDSKGERGWEARRRGGVVVVPNAASRTRIPYWPVRWDSLGWVRATSETLTAGALVALRAPYRKLPAFARLVCRGDGSGGGGGGGGSDETQAAAAAATDLVVQMSVGFEDRFLHACRAAVGEFEDRPTAVPRAAVSGVVRDIPRSFEQLVRFHLYERATLALVARASLQKRRGSGAGVTERPLFPEADDAGTHDADCDDDHDDDDDDHDHDHDNNNNNKQKKGKRECWSGRSSLSAALVAGHGPAGTAMMMLARPLPRSGYYLVSCSSFRKTLPYSAGVPLGLRQLDRGIAWPGDTPPEADRALAGPVALAAQAALCSASDDSGGRGATAGPTAQERALLAVAGTLLEP